MEAIVFVPGILGSELHGGRGMVWPPTALEVVSGYGRIDQLMGDDVRPGPPIRSVACKMVYHHILADLEVISAGQVGAPVRGLHTFGYDWRRDIRISAQALADFIEAIPAEERERIHIVAHSMGCLVSRVLIEGGAFERRDWYSQIDGLVALAGPHEGAPIAFVRAIGLEGSMGLASSDIRKLAGDPRYPALYQLFPPPGESVAWDVRRNGIDAIDIYDPESVERFGLSSENLVQAAETHAILSRKSRPAHVKYLYLAGTGLETCLRVDSVGANHAKVGGADAGDGTVPLWSALSGGVRHHAAPGEHGEMFRNKEIRELIYRALGARMPYSPFGTIDGKPVLRVVPAAASFPPVTDIGIMLVLEQAAAQVLGDLVVEFTPDVVRQPFGLVRRQPVAWNGPRAAVLNFFLDQGGPPGFYRVSFSGTHETPGDGVAVFAITAL